MYANIASLPLGLAAAYKVFIDKFVPAGLEHADTVCSTIRGDLCGKLAECCRPFVETSGKPTVTDVKLFGANGEPLDTSALTRPSAIDSESFKDAFQDFLHDERREFHRYWSAFIQKRRLQSIWALVRLVVAAWPITSLLGLGLFAAWAKDVCTVAPYPWLIAVGVTTALPVLGFVLCLAPYAVCVNGVARMED